MLRERRAGGGVPLHLARQLDGVARKVPGPGEGAARAPPPRSVGGQTER